MGRARSLEETLRSIVDNGAAWILMATITEINTHPQLGFLVDLEAKPSEKFIQARLLFLGTRPSGGSLDPVAVGDEVVVFVPSVGGFPDPNKAIAIAGLHSALAPLPAVFDNTTPERIHPNGYNFRTANGDSVAALVRKDQLDDFATWLGLFDAFLLTTSTATLAPQIAAAAVTMIAGLVTAFGSSTGFTARVGGGAANYRSTGIKSS